MAAKGDTRKTNPFSFEGILAELEKNADEKHYAELGRFVTAYAAAEAAVHMLARRLSGMSDDIARIAFGGTRLEDVIARVRGMMRIQKLNAATVEEVETCLAQLKLIADRRHRIVHRSSTFFDNAIVVTNVLTAKSLPAEVDKFKWEELSAMYGDCLAIYLRLGQVVRKEERELEHAGIVYSPWRYKPA
jgi:hypothetical protein